MGAATIALHMACRGAGDLKIAQLLLKKGADINIKDWWGETPLDMAKKHSNKKLIESLKPNERNG